MSDPLSVTQLRDFLRDPRLIESSPFTALKEISLLVLRTGDSSDAVEMILRALEFRKEFGAHREILDGLARQVGLFPFVETSSLGARDLVAYEYHRPLASMGKIVFHRVQAEVYRTLLGGENVILSAPTSFGKSRIIDALVSLEKFKNICVVVPTLALIDETRRRLSAISSKYKIITHLAQVFAEHNLFVLTAERVVAFQALPTMDFFVIDEFYKLGLSDDGDRMVALNEAFYKLRKGNGQFYLLGPNVDKIAEEVEGTLRAKWIQTDFHTVVSEQIRVRPKDDPQVELVDLCRSLKESTIVYCASPASANTVANALLLGKVGSRTPSMDAAADWVAECFHPEWVLARGLRRGIGIHHGRLPRSIGQLVVREFNREKIRFLVCTSTLIEGVNTRAKNVIIYDNKIARRDVDYFTFNNIRGRAGRMFQHFIGRVYLFSDPPDRDLPFVDVPIVSQNAAVPNSLLMQLDEKDLKPAAIERMKEFVNQDVVPIGILRQGSAIDPGAQVAVGRHLHGLPAAILEGFAWRKWPRYKQLQQVCQLIWEYLVPQARRAGITSASQLTFKTWQLSKKEPIADRVLAELKGAYAAKTVDEAVERVLTFERTWASFEIPRYLMCISRIQAHVLSKRGLACGDYSFYAQQVENLFQAPILGALDEYGIPPHIGRRLLPRLKTIENLDQALEALRMLSVKRIGMSEFEQEVIVHAQEGLSPRHQ